MNCDELLLGLGIEVDVRGAVDALGDRLDLVLDRLVVVVERRKLVRLLARLDDGLGEVGRAGAARGEALVGLGAERARLEREPLDELDLLVRVARAAVDGDDGTACRTRAMIPRWRRTFAIPTSIARSACERSTRGSSSTPPWCLIARTVVTSTTALGVSPPKRQTMSKNFSIPMSEPKPDSVTT